MIYGILLKGLGVIAAGVGMLVEEQGRSCFVASSWRDRALSLAVRIRSVLDELAGAVPTLAVPTTAGLLALALAQWALLPCLSPLSRRMTCLALLGIFHVRFALVSYGLAQESVSALNFFWRRRVRQYAASQILLAGAFLAILVLGDSSWPFRFLAGLALLFGGLLQTEEGPFCLTNDFALLEALGQRRRHLDEEAESSFQDSEELLLIQRDISQSSSGTFDALPLPPFLRDISRREGEITLFPSLSSDTLLGSRPLKTNVRSSAQLRLVQPWKDLAHKLDFLFILALVVDFSRGELGKARPGLMSLMLGTALLYWGSRLLFPLLPSVSFIRMRRTVRFVGLPLVGFLILLTLMRGQP